MFLKFIAFRRLFACLFWRFGLDLMFAYGWFCFVGLLLVCLVWFWVGLFSLLGFDVLFGRWGLCFAWFAVFWVLILVYGLADLGFGVWFVDLRCGAGCEIV